MGKKRRIIHSASKFAAKHATHPAMKIVTTTPVAVTPIVEEAAEEVIATKAATLSTIKKTKKKSPWSKK